MNETTTNPVFVGLLFILRCFVPLLILFGVSYLLRRFGLVTTESAEPPEEDAQEENGDEDPEKNQEES